MSKFKKEMPSAIGIPCYDFKVDKYQREKRTVIIAPIIIDEVSQGVLQIGWACSRGPYCNDEDCRYSHKAKKRDSHNAD